MAEHGDKDAVRGTLGGTGSGGKVSGSEESDKKPVLEKGTPTLTEPAQPNEEKADSDSHLESQEQDFSATSSVRDGSAMHTPVKPLSAARESKNTAVQPPGESLVILHLDVGQGACTLLLHSNVKNDVETKWTAVIDGGHGTPGRGQLARYLEQMDRKLDAIFLSHYDADHADGIAFLLKHHHEECCKKNCIAYVPHYGETEMIKWFRSSGIDYTKTFDTIKPPDSNLFTIKKLAGAAGKTENGKSLALLVEFGTFKYLTCGDLCTDEGEDIVADNAKRVDALFCSHHGSAHSTSANMLKKLNDPPIAVISAGRNSYGHPNSETIARLAEIKSWIYLTGCQYNRKYINNKYNAKEKENLAAEISSGEEKLTTSKSVDAIKDLSASLVSALLYIEEEAPAESVRCNNEITSIVKLLSTVVESNTKKAEIIKSLMLRSEEVKKMVNKFQFGEKESLGLVAGGESRIGLIGIRVNSDKLSQVDVGFGLDAGEWGWRHQWKREGERLARMPDIEEEVESIGSVISSSHVSKQSKSPGNYSTWNATHFQKRNLFSLSARTPRQPGQTASYTCRWCTKKMTDQMVFVECEFCSDRDVIVAYHDECFVRAISGEQIKLRLGLFGGEEHLQKDVLKSIVKNRESNDIAITIAAKYEACYRCGVFRSKKFQWFDRRSVDTSVEQDIKNRRSQILSTESSQFKAENVVTSLEPLADSGRVHGEDAPSDKLDKGAEDLDKQLIGLDLSESSEIDDQVAKTIEQRRSIHREDLIGVCLNLQDSEHPMSSSVGSGAYEKDSSASKDMSHPSSSAKANQSADIMDLTFAHFYKIQPQPPFKTR